VNSAFSIADLEQMPFTVTFALIDNESADQKHGVSAHQADGFFIEGELRVHVNPHNASLDKLKLDRASNIRGQLEVSPIGDGVGFQVVQLAELNPIASLDLTVSSQTTTLWFSEDNRTQPVTVLIETGKSRAGRILSLLIRVDWTALPRTVEHVRRYTYFFANRFNLRSVRILNNQQQALETAAAAAAAAADDDEQEMKKRKVTKLSSGAAGDE
jgi:hypothetical protein